MLKMTKSALDALIESEQYDFLRNMPELGSNIVLLGLGGSHAYGTNNENSDVDLRGVAVNSPRNIYLGRDFEQVVETETDTTVYSFDKIVNLLCSCNPNVIEILGLEPWQYAYVGKVGRLLIDNKTMFLSKVAAQTFGGYANAQLRRLDNKSARLLSQTQQEQHILKSIEFASVDYKRRYFHHPDDAIKLYVDKTDREGFDSEIFADIDLNHYPLRDFRDCMSEMHNVIKGYAKIGRRNAKAIEHNKLTKHMMHLIRLYLMAFDILEKGEIITYREKDHDFLMSLRDGAYLDADRQPTPEFFELVDEYEKRLEYDKNNAALPDRVNKNDIEDLVYTVNKMVCEGNYL